LLHPDSPVSIEVVASTGLTTMAVDGQGYYPMHEGDRVELARHPVPYPLLAFPGSIPTAGLRERLGWSGQLTPQRAEDERRIPRGADSGHGGVL
jgi:NAD kinase